MKASSSSNQPYQLLWLKERVAEYQEKMDKKHSTKEVDALLDKVCSLLSKGLVNSINDINVPHVLLFLERFEALSSENLVILLNHPLSIRAMGVALSILDRNACAIALDVGDEERCYYKIPKKAKLRKDISKLLNEHMQIFCENARSIANALEYKQTFDATGQQLYDCVAAEISLRSSSVLSGSISPAPSTSSESVSPAPSTLSESVSPVPLTSLGLVSPAPSVLLAGMFCASRSTTISQSQSDDDSDKTISITQKPSS